MSLISKIFGKKTKEVIVDIDPNTGVDFLLTKDGKTYLEIDELVEYILDNVSQLDDKKNKQAKTALIALAQVIKSMKK
jgi:hypothetical protein